MNWSPDPPWGPQEGSLDTERTCVRCSGHIAERHRHYWPGCARCAVWSFIGQQLLAVFGLDGHPWLYWGARPGCQHCDGSGYLSCEDQDLSSLRKSGPCGTCGAYSMVLYNRDGMVPGSARHYDDVADHEVVVGAWPLGRAVAEHLDRAVPEHLARQGL